MTMVPRAAVAPAISGAVRFPSSVLGTPATTPISPTS